MSNINPNNINGSYPVAGQDNDSQGFRDNFTNILNNFNFCKSEIEDLQDKVLLKNQLQNTILDNDMNFNTLGNAALRSAAYVTKDFGSINGTVAVDFNDGNFFHVTSGGSLSLALSNFPVQFGVVRLWVTITNVAHTLQFPTAVSIGSSTVAGFGVNGLSSTITFESTGEYIFDIGSYDNGITYFLVDILRNRRTIEGNVDISGNVNVVKDVVITGNITIAGDLNISANLDINNSVNSNVATNGDLVAGGNLYLGNTAATIFTPNVGTLTYSGNLLIGNLQTTGLSMTGNLNLSSNINLTGSAYVSGTQRVTGNLTTGNVSTGIVTATGDISSGGMIAATGNISAGGNISTVGNLTITGIGSGLLATSVNVYGNLVTNNGRINTSLLPLTVVTSQEVVGNVMFNTFVLDTASSATIANLWFTLPTSAVNGTEIVISSLAPITSANIRTITGGVKWVPSGTFSAGNVAVKLIYNTASAAWLKVA
jgi:predicted acyltransferase (DUF342 family)